MKLTLDEEECKLYLGNAIDCVRDIPQNTIQAVITSPTYWGKRQFTNESEEFGKEKLEEYLEKNIELYTAILEKMKDTGSLFIIIQDSYMGSGVSRSHHNHWENNIDPSWKRVGTDSKAQGNTSSVTAHHKIIKNKSLVGIPYRIAIALVDKGFIWREQIIWEKPNPMPENIQDRVRQSCEYILHFTKNGKYKFNNKHFMITGTTGKPRLDNQVWNVSPSPKKGHSATFPEKIVSRLMLSVTDRDDVVFEPFLGSGTMLELALKHGRKFIGCDINQEFVKNGKKLFKQRSTIDKFV